MSQITGSTLSVTNGSAIITDASATWQTDGVSAGDGFTVITSGVTYEVGSVDSETQITLTANYAGTTATNVSYVLFRDFTSPDSIPELSAGDIETATIWTRAVRKIQDLFTQYKTLISSTVTHNFSSDADYTLTATQELYGRIVLTDTTPVLTDARNVIVSTTARGHWFVNNTLQTLTIKTSAGTGINLTPGMSRYYIGDGTNVVEGDNSVTTMPFSFRNKIINGDFDFWDYATSQTSAGYGSDNRWNNYAVGSTKTHSRQTFTLGQTDVPNNPKYYSQTIVTSVAGANNLCVKLQNIESVKSFAGKIVTLTFYAKADASKNIATEFTQYFGSGGSPSSVVNSIGVTTHALTTSWQKFTVTTSIPSISGKTLGSNGDDLLELRFWFDAGSTFDSRTNSLGQQSGTFDIAQVQLEEGSVATPFEQRPLAIERELCQRYMIKYKPLDVYTPLGNGRWHASTNAVIQMHLPTTMRATPTLILEGAVSQYFINTFGTLGGAAITSLTLSRASDSLIMLDVGYTTGGQTAGVGTTLYTNNQTTYGLYFSAEL